MSTSAQLADNYAGLLNGEERTQLESLRNSCVYALNPTNIVEVALFDLLVLTAWKIERTNRLEAVVNPLQIENSAERTQISHPLQPNLRHPAVKTGRNEPCSCMSRTQAIDFRQRTTPKNVTC